MKLLVVHPHLDLVGGSENLTRILLYELVEYCPECEIVVATRDKNPELFPDHKKIKFYFFKKMELYSKCPVTSKIIDLLITYDEILHDETPDIALIMIQEPVHALLLKTVKPGFKTAIYIHYPFEEELTETNLLKFFEMYRFPNVYNEYYKYVDSRFVNSHYTLDALYRHYGIDADVVYPAVSWAYFENEPDLTEKRGKTILSVGRFVPHKRLDTLIKMFREHIKPKIPEAELVIIGIPDIRYMDYYKEIMRLAEETKDVTVISRALKDEEMISYYRHARVYAHLRIGEHFGMAPVEAMSQGAIPVIPRDSGLAELVTHGKDGFAYENDRQLLEYMLHLLQMDDDELVKMRRRAVRTSYYFTPARFAKEIYYHLKVIASK
ncbi:MAG: glycosyltransferase family 4 protein [Crenarchaeota archaeon]|nr:glycosyltransferase family 4 protein [Thermoproteota archaeon]